MAYDGIGTSGNQLQTGGAGTLPTWAVGSGAGITSINVQTFTTSGTYTPTAGMKYCIVEVVGGGGAGGGCPTTGSGQYSGGAGGGGGEYAKGIYNSVTIGSSQIVTIGSGGLGVIGANGNSGNTTSFGSLITANGGAAGQAAGPNSQIVSGGYPGGSGGSGGYFRTPGNPSGPIYYDFYSVGGVIAASNGGSSFYGTSGIFQFGGNNGGNGGGYGGGGSGTVNGPSSGISYKGGNGSSGICIVTEFIA